MTSNQPTQCLADPATITRDRQAGVAAFLKHFWRLNHFSVKEANPPSARLRLSRRRHAGLTPTVGRFLWEYKFLYGQKDFELQICSFSGWQIMEFISSIMMLFFAPFLGTGWFGAVLLGFLTFDELVKTEHQEFHDNWEKDGRPYGLFWASKESTFFRSSFARNRLMCYWLFATPKWIGTSTNAK